MNQELTPQKHSKKSPMFWLVTVLAILAAIFVLYVIITRYFTGSSPIPTNIFKNASEKTIKTAVSNLDGLEVPEDVANRHPLAVMIENHPEARPQVGLDQASIVYEAITEGGITRFMGIYGPRIPDKVGPVRSARTYFVDWLSEFDAFYAHVGGNLDALDMIKQVRILDLDQFALGAPTYWREPATGVAIEHTMFSSPEKLYNQAYQKGWPKAGSFQALKFRKETTSVEPVAQTISIDFSSTQYLVSWKYDAVEKAYLRTMGGYPHKDRVTGNQLEAQNIIIQSVERQAVTTAINEQGFAMTTTGTGKAMVFQEGKKIDATWKKLSRTSRTHFYDTDSNEIKFIPGLFWIEITPPDVFANVKID